MDHLDKYKNYESSNSSEPLKKWNQLQKIIFSDIDIGEGDFTDQNSVNSRFRVKLQLYKFLGKLLVFQIREFAKKSYKKAYFDMTWSVISGQSDLVGNLIKNFHFGTALFNDDLYDEEYSNAISIWVEDGGVIIGSYYNTRKHRIKDKTFKYEDILKQFDTTSPLFFNKKFLEKTLKHIESLQIGWLSKTLHFGFEEYSLKREGRIKLALNSWFTTWSKLNNDLLLAVIEDAVNKHKLGSEPKQISYLRSDFPKFFQVIKNMREDDEKWKGELNADLGDIGF